MKKQYDEDDQYEFLDNSVVAIDQELSQSEITYPAEQLSGDENDEKDAMTSLVYSQVQRKEGQTYKPIYGTITVMKSVLGSGVLGLPYVVANFGPILACGMFIIVCIATQYACVLLLKAKNLSRHSNYTTISQTIVGTSGKVFISIIVILGNIGVSIAELIIFGDTIRIILENTLEEGDEVLDKWYTSFEFLVGCVGLLMSPFMFLKTIDKLRHVSLIAIFAVLSFAVLCTYNFIQIALTQDELPEIYLWPQNFDIWRALGCLPTILLAFSFQYNFFPIFKAIEKTSDQKMLKVTMSGLLGAMTIYFIVGLMGSFSYLPALIQSDYLKTIDKNRIGLPLFVSLNLSFSIATTLSMPIIFFGGRNNILSLLQLLRQWLHDRKQKRLEKKMTTQKIIDNYREDIKASINSNLEENDQNSREEKLRFQKKKFNPKITGVAYVFVVLIAYFTTVAIAIVIKDLGVVFNIIGSLVCNSVGFILPAFFYIGLTKKKNIHYYLAWLLFIISMSLGILCIVAQQVFNSQ